jgi:acyl carrier protein phosphodiesterase
LNGEKVTEQAWTKDEVEEVLKAIAQHRQILQGMAVHIQEINGRLVALEQEFELFIEAVSANAEEPEEVVVPVEPVDERN